MRALVIGVAGFLGFHAAGALLRRGASVLGLDRLDPGADPALVEARLQRLRPQVGFTLVSGDARDPAFLEELARREGAELDVVLDLASRPCGASATAVAARLTQQLAVLDVCRLSRRPTHLVQVLPCAVTGIDLAEERLGRAYARLHGQAQTALRLAEVYGPWGRPDGWCWRHADAIIAGRPVLLPEADGALRLLWIEDAVAGLLAALDRPPQSPTPYRRLDLAGAEPTAPDRLLGTLEHALGRRAQRRHEGPARTVSRSASSFDLDATHTALGWRPAVGIEEGVQRFVAWYQERRAPSQATGPVPHG